MTECKTHFSIVAGLSESGVPPRLADHDGGRPTTERCGVHGSDARSQCECQDTGLLESGDDHKPRLALPVTRGSERCIAHPTAGAFLVESLPALTLPARYESRYDANGAIVLDAFAACPA